MICQRSGRCCVNMFVVVVVRENDQWRLKDKPGGLVCPNLVIAEGGEASCKVHNEPWYKFTACNVYGNPELDIDHAANPTRPCQVGLAHREHKLDPRRDAIEAPGLPLDLGPMTWSEDEGINFGEGP